MLTDSEFLHYALKIHRLRPAARQYLAMVRSSTPARRVGARALQNVCSEFSSRKMRQTIQTESHTAERAFVLMCEYDNRVLEIWDQSQPINVERTDKNGRKCVGSYVADFAVLTNSGPNIVEVKTEEFVEQKLSAQHPDWMRSDVGDVVYLPAQESFFKLGLHHRVFVYKSDMRYLVANLGLMLASRDTEGPGDYFKRRVLEVFSHSFAMTLSDIKSRLDLKNYTALTQLIDAGFLHFSIDKELIAYPENCLVVLAKDLLSHAHSIRERQLLIAQASEASISCEVIPNQYQAEQALDRLRRLDSGESSRSARRWKKRIDAGLQQGLTPLQSLIPKVHLRGNRSPKINTLVATHLNDYLLNEHAELKGISNYRSYIRYREGMNRIHPAYEAVSQKTFRSHLRQLPPEQIALKRGGNRLANAATAPTDPEHRALVPQVAWQIAAIDHYLADIYLICASADGVVYVMRPWITAMIDRCTSAVLALTISFRPPSRRACAKVIRECLRQHGQLPREIIVDRGADFRSVYFAALLGGCRVTLSFRPAGHSRYGGADIERFFGEYKEQWLTQRPGNLADYREARSVDGAFSPAKSAILRPTDFYRELKVFCGWRDSKCRGIKSESASLLLHNDMAEFPFVGISINYDHAFIVASAVDCHTYKIDFQRGLHIDGQYYWHPDISLVRGKKRSLEVRIDPENPHVVYALIENKWATCATTQNTVYRVKDGISQFVEGLLIREATASRAKAKIEADEALVRIVRQMDQMIHPGIIPAIEVDSEEKSESTISIFSKIKKSGVSSLRREAWSR